MWGGKLYIKGTFAVTLNIASFFLALLRLTLWACGRWDNAGDEEEGDADVTRGDLGRAALDELPTDPAANDEGIEDEEAFPALSLPEFDKD